MNADRTDGNNNDVSVLIWPQAEEPAEKILQAADERR
jgi:hypothetical protein